MPCILIKNSLRLPSLRLLLNMAVPSELPEVSLVGPYFRLLRKVNSAEYLGSTDGCCWLLEPLWWGWSHWRWRSWSQWKPQAADLPEIPTYPTRGKEWERDTSGSGPLSNFTPSSFSLHLGDHCPHSLRPSAPPAKQQEIIRIFLETQGIIILTSVPV